MDLPDLDMILSHYKDEPSTWLDEVQIRIDKMLRSPDPAAQKLGRQLVDALEFMNILARTPLVTEHSFFSIRLDQKVKNLRQIDTRMHPPGPKPARSADPANAETKAPLWWDPTNPHRYVDFRKNTRELIRQACEEHRPPIALPASKRVSDASYLKALTNLAGRSKLKPEPRKIPAEQFAAAVAAAIGVKETLEEIDHLPGGLSDLGAMMEKKIGLL